MPLNNVVTEALKTILHDCGETLTNAEETALSYSITLTYIHSIYVPVCVCKSPHNKNIHIPEDILVANAFS